MSRNHESKMAAIVLPASVLITMAISYVFDPFTKEDRGSHPAAAADLGLEHGGSIHLISGIQASDIID